LVFLYNVVHVLQNITIIWKQSWTGEEWGKYTSRHISSCQDREK
jgi:hypothetical protein